MGTSLWVEVQVLGSGDLMTRSTKNYQGTGRRQDSALGMRDFIWSPRGQSCWKLSHLRTGLNLRSKMGCLWARGWDGEGMGRRGRGSQEPRLHIAKLSNSNLNSTPTSCVTSSNKLLHLPKTSPSSLWVNQEIVLPQRAVGMSSWDLSWRC